MGMDIEISSVGGQIRRKNPTWIDDIEARNGNNRGP